MGVAGCINRQETCRLIYTPTAVVYGH